MVNKRTLSDANVTSRDWQTIMLGAFIQNRDLYNEFAPKVNEDVVTEPDLRRLYEAMLESHGEASVPDLAGKVPGGLAFVRDIAQSYRRYGVDKNLSSEEASKVVRSVVKFGRLHQERTLLNAAVDRLQPKDGKSELSIADDEIVGELVNQLVQVQFTDRQQPGFRPYRTFLKQFAKHAQRIQSGLPATDRQMTGFRTFDRETTGLPKPGLIVIGGVPGSGKTQLAWQWVLKIAKSLYEHSEDGICAVNSAEMTGMSLASRSVLSAAGLDSNDFRQGKFKDDDETNAVIAKEIRRQAKWPVYVDDSDVLTSHLIAARLAGLRARYGRIVIVATDFAEIISDPGDSQEQRVASVFVNSKALAKRLNCPVVLLSQVSRAVDASGSHIPSIRHLRYSGMAEAIADMIILIYNPKAYEDAGVKLIQHQQMPVVENQAYLIIGKNREGPIGKLNMGWVPEFTRWSDIGPKAKIK